MMANIRVAWQVVALMQIGGIVKDPFQRFGPTHDMRYSRLKSVQRFQDLIFGPVHNRLRGFCVRLSMEYPLRSGTDAGMR